MTKEKQRIRRLRRAQLDELFRRLGPVTGGDVPQGAWIRDIREALGMSATQMARRLGITPPALKKLEANELKLVIELRTLQRAAAAMNCRLVYALIPTEPTQGTLEATLRARARQLATKLVTQVSHTMALEDQAVTRQERERQIAETADELVRNLDRRLWDVD